MEHELLDDLRSALSRVAETNEALERLVPQRRLHSARNVGSANPVPPPTSTEPVTRDEIYRALLALSEPLARSCAQVKDDLEDRDRISWAGDAHEIREVLATMLRMLAPEERVTARPWFRREADNGQPTQKQRVRYILENHGAGSVEREVAEQIELLDDSIGDLIRAIYSRASDAAHRLKDRSEVIRILR